MNWRPDQTAASGRTRPSAGCVAAPLMGGFGCHTQAQGAGMSVATAHQHGGAALRRRISAHVLRACVAVAATALLVAGSPTTQAQTLECATISGGSGVLPDGSILVIGQSIVGTISNAQFTIELGIVPCLIASNAVNPSAIPTVSEWGLAVMVLLVLTTGTTILRKRVGCR